MKNGMPKMFYAWVLYDPRSTHAHEVCGSRIQADARAKGLPGIFIQKIRCVPVGKPTQEPW